MASEQLPELNKGEQDPENDADKDTAVGPEESEYPKPLSRQELARLAARLAIPPAAKSPEEGSDTYLG